MKENKKHGFWREVFSENGIGSSKRILGTLMIIIALGCTVFLTIKEGGTNTVEGLIQTSIIVGSSLLGLSSITGIWKHGNISIDKKKQEEFEKENDGENLSD